MTLGGDRKKLPHLTTIINPLNGQSYELLITVPGRAPLCLKCKQTGHFTRACQTPFCRHHNQYGHTTESCSFKKATYANVVRSNLLFPETVQTETGGEAEEQQLNKARAWRQQQQSRSPRLQCERHRQPCGQRSGTCR